MTGGLFGDPPDPIHWKIAYRFDLPRRPLDGKAIDKARSAKAEAEPHVTG
jgi:hypothetical protein